MGFGGWGRVDGGLREFLGLAHHKKKHFKFVYTGNVSVDALLGVERVVGVSVVPRAF